PGAVTDRRAAVGSALMALGYPRATAVLAAERVCGTAKGDVPLEELVKQGLAALSSTPATADPLG
ncbi:MAG: hypothetical protein ACYTCU_08180, partial [Planctomycetota bacterium]